MIVPLLLAAAAGAQAAPPAGTAPPGRFIICPGNVRCPARPSRQDLRGGGMAYRMTDPGHGRRVNFTGPRDGGGSPGNSLDFAAGDATLNTEARELLDLLVDNMRIAHDLDALVEGHADVEEARANAALAGLRAEAAANYLLARGVPAGRILVVSWGDRREPGLDQPRSVVVTLRPHAP